MFCFYAKQQRVIAENFTMVRNNLQERERSYQESKNWCKSLLSWSPWLTTLFTVVDRPLILLLLALAVEVCLLSCLFNYVKQKVNSVNLLVLRG